MNLVCVFEKLLLAPPISYYFRIMTLVTIAGWAGILYVLAKLLTYLSKYVRTPLNVNKLGDWALVTGATDGIGG